MADGVSHGSHFLPSLSLFFFGSFPVANCLPFGKLAKLERDFIKLLLLINEIYSGWNSSWDSLFTPFLSGVSLSLSFLAPIDLSTESSFI